jgi:hypothetical protein
MSQQTNTRDITATVVHPVEHACAPVLGPFLRSLVGLRGTHNWSKYEVRGII